MRRVLAIATLLTACGSRTGLQIADTDSLDGSVDASSIEAGLRDVAYKDAPWMDAAGDAGSFSFSAGAKCVDHVSPADEGVVPDGKEDACFKAPALPGNLDGLILVTVDEQGAPCCGQEWDTLIGDEPLPQMQFGLGFGKGAQTWVLGAATCDKGCPLLNDAKGHLALGGTRANPKAVILYASDSGYFVHGQRFRLFARTPDGWLASTVVTWP